MAPKSASQDEVFHKLKNIIDQFLMASREKDLRKKPAVELYSDIYDDLGMDSLEAMDLVAAIEKGFKIPLDPEEITQKRKVNEIVECICGKIS